MTTTEISPTVQSILQGDNVHPILTNLAPLFTAIEANVATYNAVAAQLAAAEGDRDAAVQSWMDSTNDESAVALRNVIKEATERLNTLAQSAVGDSRVTDEEKARIKTAKEEAEKKLRASSKAVRGLAEPFNLDVTPILRKLNDPFTPKVASGTGSSLPRPSVYIACMRNHDPKQTMTFDTLSAGAKHMDYDLEQLGRKYASVAGKPYEEVSKVDTVQKFEWQNESVKGAPHWTITITPKDKSERGRPAVAETPSTAKAVEPTQEQEQVA
jgi:hypothetical protein